MMSPDGLKKKAGHAHGSCQCLESPMGMFLFSQSFLIFQLRGI